MQSANGSGSFHRLVLPLATVLSHLLWITLIISFSGLYEGLEWLTDTIANQTARDAVEVFVAGAQTSSAPKSN